MIGGLLTQREWQAFGLYATAPVQAVLDVNPVFEVLACDVVRRQTVALDEPVSIAGLSVTLFAVPGTRLIQAPKDVDFALDYIDEHARSRVKQEQVLNALQVRHTVGHAGCVALRLCRAGLDSTRRVCARSISVPRFNQGFRLRRDDVRGSWIVLIPERIFALDDYATKMLQLVDGTWSTADIVGVLAEKFAAPTSEIGADVEAMLQDLKSKGSIAL